jgi:4-coumarate--CoA ligase
LRSTAINYALKASEIASVIEACRPAVLVTSNSPEGLDTLLEALNLLEDRDLARQYRTGTIYVVDVNSQDYAAKKDSHSQGVVSKRPDVYAAPSNADGLMMIEDWTSLLDYNHQGIVIPGYNEHNEAARRTAIILWSSGTSGKSKGGTPSQYYIAPTAYTSINSSSISPVILSHQAVVAAVQVLWYGKRFYRRF